MKKYLPVIFAWLGAIIMAQTLFFKFTAASESVFIFSTLGVEPWGRIGAGICEVIACLLLVMPKSRWIGAILGIGIMAGAILAHLFILGISVQNDGGYLFFLALVVMVSCIAVVVLEKSIIIAFLKVRKLIS